MKNHYFTLKLTFFSKKIFLLLILVFFISAYDISAQTQTNFAGTGVSIAGIGTTTWTNPAKITLDDNIAATVDGNSRYLRGTNFGFNIPAGSIINGITLDVKRKTSSTTGSRWTRDNVVKLVKNNVIVGTDYGINTNYPNNTYATITYGSPNDLWGTSWTAADINNANFGAAFSVNINGPIIVSVDFFRITVYYTGPPIITSFSPSSACFNSGSTVTIIGTNFTGATDVSFNGSSATFSVDSSTKITATLPNGATTGKITVTTPIGTGTSATNFTVHPLPTVAPIVGADDVCKYATTTFTIATTGGI